jgi:hypothetical protein
MKNYFLSAEVTANLFARLLSVSREARPTVAHQRPSAQAPAPHNRTLSLEGMK